MKKAVLYIHGKGGSAAEADHYKELFTSYEVIGLDYKTNTHGRQDKRLCLDSIYAMLGNIQ